MSFSNSFRWIISILMIPFMAIMVLKHQHDFIFVWQSFDVTRLGLVFALITAMLALNGLPFAILMRGLGYRIHWQHWVGLSFIANFVNQLLPYRPGLALRFMVLKKHYQVSLKSFTFVTLFYFVFLFTSACSMVLLSQLFMPMPAEFNQSLNQASFVLLGLITLLIAFHLITRKREHSKLKLLSFFAKAKRMLTRVDILSASLGGMILIQAICWAAFYCIFTGLGMPITLSQSIFFLGFITLGMLFPITPGNIGLLEVALGTLTDSLYGHFSYGFSALLIFRAAQLGVGLLFGSFFSFWLLKGSPFANKAGLNQQ